MNNVEEKLTPPPAALRAQQEPETKADSKNETQEMLNKLEKAYNESVQACVQCNEEFEKLQAKRFETERKRFQAYANLTALKEQLLMNAVNQLQQNASQAAK